MAIQVPAPDAESEEEKAARLAEEARQNNLQTQEGLIKKSVEDYLKASDEATQNEVLSRLPQLKEEILNKVKDSILSSNSNNDSEIQKMKAEIEALKLQKAKEDSEKEEESVKELLITELSKRGIQEDDFISKQGITFDSDVAVLAQTGVSKKIATELVLSRIFKDSQLGGNNHSPEGGVEKVKLTSKVMSFYEKEGIEFN